MKYLATLILIFTFTQMTQAREACGFLCKEIPDTNEIITQYGRASLAGLNRNSIRVHVWNLYKGRKPNFANDYATLPALSDLILTQETMFENGPIQQLLTPQDFSTVSANSFFTKDGITGVAISSRAPEMSVNWFRTKVKEPLVKSYKLTILNEYLIDGSKQTLLVASIHGINRNTAQDLGDQVSDVLAAARPHTGPFLFAGDFNARNQARQDAVDAAMKANGFTKVIWENEYRQEANKLDYAYVRGLKVNKAILKPEFVGGGSDHPLLYLDLGLAN